MSHQTPLSYRIRRGLSKPLRDFDYRTLKYRILGWRTDDDAPGYQTTLEMFQ